MVRVQVLVYRGEDGCQDTLQTHYARSLFTLHGLLSGRSTRGTGSFLFREAVRRLGLRHVRGLGLREACWCGRPDLVDDHSGAVEPFVLDRLEAPLELGDHLLVWIFVRYEMEDLLVVSLFHLSSIFWKSLDRQASASFLWPISLVFR